ncbi:hypothetical protein TcYC6_0003230 [Trypanosoma cruzi]|nr:hypothetical protein TcYC6_0003230 [Trypanosoma cruzi]
MRRRLWRLDKYTEQGIAPLWHTDLLTCFTTQLTNKWRSTIRQDTHRYLLCGTRPSDLSGKDLITQEVLHRQETGSPQGQGAANLSSGVDYTGL